MNNKQTKKPLGLSIPLGPDIEDSSLHEHASKLNIRFNSKQASKDPNLSLMLLVSSGLEQFLSSDYREPIDDASMERIVREVQSYSPHTTKEKLKRQAVGSNDILRIVQALTASVSPVLQCSEADILRSKSVKNDTDSVMAKEQSKYLGRSVYELAKSAYQKSSESENGLSSLGIVLSLITTICTSSRSLGVSRDVLAIALLSMVQDIVTEDLQETNPLRSFTHPQN